MLSLLAVFYSTLALAIVTALTGWVFGLFARAVYANTLGMKDTV